MNRITRKFRYLGNNLWKEVPDEIARFWGLHNTTDGRRFMIYFFFDKQNGTIFSEPNHVSLFGENKQGITVLPVGSVVEVHRDWKKAFPTI